MAQVCLVGAFLDEWRFSDDVVSFPDQLRWFEGSHLTVSRPQNIQGSTGHLTYEGSAPIFATSKLADLAALEELAADDPATGEPKCAEASMLMRRLRVYRLSKRIPKPQHDVPYCGCCFAKLVLGRGVPEIHGLWDQTAFV